MKSLIIFFGILLSLPGFGQLNPNYNQQAPRIVGIPQGASTYAPKMFDEVLVTSSGASAGAVVTLSAGMIASGVTKTFKNKNPLYDLVVAPASGVIVDNTNGGSIASQLLVPPLSTLTLVSNTTDSYYIVGTIKKKVIPKIANYTIPSVDFATSSEIVIYVDATAGPVTITLAPYTQVKGGTTKVIKIDASANAVTVKGTGAELINSANTDILSTQWAKGTYEALGAGYGKF